MDVTTLKVAVPTTESFLDGGRQILPVSTAIPVQFESCDTQIWSAVIGDENYVVHRVPSRDRNPFRLCTTLRVLGHFENEPGAMLHAVRDANDRVGPGTFSLVWPARPNPYVAPVESVPVQESSEPELLMYQRVVAVVGACLRDVYKIPMGNEISALMHNTLRPAIAAVGAVRGDMSRGVRFDIIDRMEVEMMRRKQQAGGCQNCGGTLGLDSCKASGTYVNVLRCSNCGHVQPIPEGEQ